MATYLGDKIPDLCNIINTKVPLPLFTEDR